MSQLTAALDRLPTAVRDFLVAFVAVAAAFVFNAVIDAGGVTGLDWVDVGLGAVNAGAVAAALVGALALSPLTTAYGRGAGRADVDASRTWAGHEG